MASPPLLFAVAQLPDACTLYACWADVINIENMDSVLSNTDNSLMRSACLALNSPGNWTISRMKEATDIPEALKTSRTLYLSQSL